MGPSRAAAGETVSVQCKVGACTVMLLAAITVVTQLLWGFAFNNLSLRFVTVSHQKETLGIHEDENGREGVAAAILIWEEAAAAPVARLDGAAVQIAHLLYVFAGYATIDEVHAHVDVYNLSSDTWGARFAMPAAMAHSHLGMATDGMRFIYVVSGQWGSQCRAPTASNFVLDTHTRTWSQLLPPLPHPRNGQHVRIVLQSLPSQACTLTVPRNFITSLRTHNLQVVASSHRRRGVALYAPATQLWGGRLHVMGGSEEDRQQPAVEHWSILVHNGQALESQWRDEISIPRGGPHRACVVVDDDLYVIGGQEGDFKAKPGSPDFKCSRQKEVVYGDVYLLKKGSRRWSELPSLPKPVSHIEFAWVTFNRSIIIVGGSTVNHPLTKKMVLLADVFHYNTETRVWKTLGHMPYRGKTVLAAYWKGWLYFTAGQRDKGPSNPAPSKIMAKTWRTKLVI